MSSFSFIRFCESAIDMEWTNEKYLRFIDDYRNSRVLWDIRNPNYKNNSKKRNVVLRLAQKYDIEEGVLKKKIKNLRSAFHREHHRLTSKRVDSVDEVRKWFAYDSLKFILDVTGPSGAIKEDPSFTSDEPIPQNDTEEDMDYSERTQLIELPPLLPERPSPENNVLNPVLVSKEEDEYDLFGRSMAMQLRKIPEITALELMQKMQLMMLNARKQLSKGKSRTKHRVVKTATQPSTSITNAKRVRTPSPDLSSPRSTPSPSYKFEVMSPSDTTSRVSQGTDRDFTYVTTVEHTGSFPISSDAPEDVTEGTVTIEIQREGKRKLSNSVDPLEVKQSKLCGSHFKHE